MKIHCIIKVPQWIWRDNYLTRYFIKGVFDTDGSLCLKKNQGKYLLYPVISIKLKDNLLIKDIAKWTRTQNIPFYSGYESYLDKRTGKIYGKFSLQISVYKNVEKWIKYIGTSNPKQKEKMGRVGFEPTIVEG